ncbi:deoxynucleotidyltransferase terminal-interacting protein 2 isoform X2 [Puntigrus tetrazona]|uniref:deoxynucleotidyltransferase terminal-interacting protein 2 isoform X2 n=1 Tax=Puntigrus tetrazona TaxID=1606681 RepID=UPI001C89737A|nr:deoxynucleotidyltransferase terminal-interacting protein 2 isoform X2 [Puntigrus tetrazona]
MVATRRGTRVGSPVKNTSEENSGDTPTPSTRRTQRRTLMEENQSNSELADASQTDELKYDSTASSSVASPPKRGTRRSTRLLADKKEPHSTNEADVSESESSCSVVSDMQATPRTRRRTAVREKPTVQDEASEVESCSSEVSTTRSHRVLRSLRKRVLASAAIKDAIMDDDGDPSGPESCSSAVSLTTAMDTRRITRSHRKTAVPSTEADSSEPESCSSSVSGLRGSAVRRSSRNQKVKSTKPIPLSFEETTDTPSSPVSKKRGCRRKTVYNEENDSDGCKSGPSMSPWRSTRHQPKLGESDSELVATDVCKSLSSQSPQRGRGTPCSSRTGSASSTRAVPVTRARSKAKADVGDTITTAAAMTEDLGEELEPHPESIPVFDGDKADDTVEILDSTLVMDTSEAQECTIIEESTEDTTVVLNQGEPIKMQESQSTMQDAEPLEYSGTETLTLKEESVAATSGMLIEEPGDVAMENDEPEFVETSHFVENQTCSVLVKEDVVEAVSEDPKPAVAEEAIEDQRCSEHVEDTVEAVADETETAVVEEAIEDQRCSEPVEDTVEAVEEEPETAVVEEAIEDQRCSEPVEDTVEAVEEEPETAVVEEAIEDQRCSEPVEDTVEAVEEEPETAVVEEAIEDQRCSEPVEDTVEAVEEEPETAVVEEAIEAQIFTEPVEDVVETTPEDPVPTVVEEHENKLKCEKQGVIVYEEANDTIKTTENNFIMLNDLEGPSTSSRNELNLMTTEEISKKCSPQKKMISLLDSSEDEDSADEGLTSEEEGCSQKAEDVEMCSQDNVMFAEGKASKKTEAPGNGLFVIDNKPGQQSKKQYYVAAKQTEEQDEEDFVDEEGDDDDDEDSRVLFTSRKPLMQLSSAIDTGLKMKELGGLYISFDGNKPKSHSNSLKSLKDPNNPDELLKKSVIVPEFEKKDAVPPYSESKHAAKLKRKAEREKTTGDGWFNMRAPELTEELKNDLKVLKMRSALDPKRFYKKNDREGPPKYFQVGTVVDNPVDFYSSRIPKKQRKRTMVEELLADAEFRSYNKKKYQEIMAEKAAQAAGKMNKKKHKFHKKKMNK